MAEYALVAGSTSARFRALVILPKTFFIFGWDEREGVGGYLFFEMVKSESAGLRMQGGVSRYRVCFLFLFFP